MEVFALKHLEWRDQGKRYMCYATQRVHLPIALASRAVDRGVAFLVGDERIPEARTRIQLEARARNGQPSICLPATLSRSNIPRLNSRNRNSRSLIAASHIPSKLIGQNKSMTGVEPKRTLRLIVP
jgi:hypothetical protein